MYDLIGDIHGYADHLEALLNKLGYRKQNGTWSHPDRQVIFLGDFIDRGPLQLDTVRIARDMVEAGNALAVMGNHEFNAVSYATPDPDYPGEFLRRHDEKNERQHGAFLQAVGQGSALHQEIVAWFKTLPLYLDLPELRVVHACWHEPSLQVLDGYLDQHNCLRNEAWVVAARADTEVYEAVEVILKGLEVPLPGDAHFFDKDNNLRRHFRARWWQKNADTYKDVAMVPPGALASIPDETLPADLLPGYDGRKLLFLGHYWLQAETPVPLTRHIACLDYSIAIEDVGESNQLGKLVAYRWHGEDVLTPDHFVWVS